MSDVTRVIRAVVRGHADVTEDLLPLVYDELRTLAQEKLRNERSDHTLQATALVHEAYLRLVGSVDGSWESRAHFFGAAAEAMRRILIDHARAKQTKKRGGAAKKLDITGDAIPWLEKTDELLALDEAMQALELLDKPKADLVKLRFYGGITSSEAARVLNISTRTAERYWSYARVWLMRHMEES